MLQCESVRGVVIPPVDIPWTCGWSVRDTKQGCRRNICGLASRVHRWAGRRALLGSTELRRRTVRARLPDLSPVEMRFCHLIGCGDAFAPCSLKIGNRGV